MKVSVKYIKDGLNKKGIKTKGIKTNLLKSFYRGKEIDLLFDGDSIILTEDYCCFYYIFNDKEALKTISSYIHSI